MINDKSTDILGSEKSKEVAHITYVLRITALKLVDRLYLKMAKRTVVKVAPM